VDWGWLIPVIILLIWIINHVLRGNEEARPANRPEGEARAPRRPATEIDRFLDEVNRRRRQAAERGQAPASRPTPAPAKVATRQPPRPPAVRPASTPRVKRPLHERVKEPPTVEAVVIEALAAAPPLPETPAFPPPPPPGAAGPALPPVVNQLSALLETPDSLRTAIMLREILGPPRCRRNGQF
jgi:hypothetical protein